MSSVKIRLTEIVEKSHAKSTDYQNLESVKEFSDKCVEAAENGGTRGRPALGGVPRRVRGMWKM